MPAQMSGMRLLLLRKTNYCIPRWIEEEYRQNRWPEPKCGYSGGLDGGSGSPKQESSDL